MRGLFARPRDKPIAVRWVNEQGGSKILCRDPIVSDELTGLMQEIVSSLYAFMLQIDERILVFDRKIDEIFKASEALSRIAVRSEGSDRRRQTSQ